MGIDDADISLHFWTDDWHPTCMQIAVLQDLIVHFREKELGGRVFSCTTGSAPSAKEVLAWLDEVMSFPILNGYGSTECGVTILNNKIVPK